MNHRLVAVITFFALLMPSSVHAADDPYPGLSAGDEIPGTRVWSTTETSWAAFYNTTRAAGWACPRFETPNGDPYAWDGNGFDTNEQKWYRVCYKNPWRVYDQAAWDAYREALEAAQRAAEEESRAWNAANPGRQKCVQWGPIVDPYGGESSGGVCANPVPADSAPSGASSSAAASVGESDLASSSGAIGASSSGSVSSSSGVTSSSPVTALPADPTPPATSYRGSGYPYTQIVEGQVGVSGCPVGFQAANGLIANVATGKTYTECWPERAWAAYRLGGEAWELYKATGGGYDPSVEIDRRNKVELLKSKAKEVAEVAARQTPGVERCSAWSGFGESGTECAYAFVVPSSTSGSASTSATTSVSIVSSSSETVSPIAGQINPSGSETIAVALSATQIEGSSLLIARQALVVTPDEVEAASISALATGITKVSTVQRSLLQTLPRDNTLDYKVVSLTPKVCKASTYRVRITSAGVCKVEIEITDSAGNEYGIVKKLRRIF